MSKKEEIIKQREALLKKLEEEEVQDRLKNSAKSAAVPRISARGASSLLASEAESPPSFSRAAARATSSTGISARGDPVPSRRASEETSSLRAAARATSPPSTIISARGEQVPVPSRHLLASAVAVEPSSRAAAARATSSTRTARGAHPVTERGDPEPSLLASASDAKPSSSRAARARDVQDSSRRLAESAAGVESRTLSPRSLRYEEPVVTSRAASRRKAVEESEIPVKPVKPEKKKSWFHSLFSLGKENPPAQNPSASSTTLDVEGSEVMRRSSLKVASEGKGKASVRSSLKANERSSSPAPDLFRSNSQEELEAFAFVPGDPSSRSRSSQNFAEYLETGIRPSSKDDPETLKDVRSRVQPISNLRSSQEKLANVAVPAVAVPAPPPLRRSLSNSRIVEPDQGSAMPSSSSELPRPLKSSLKPLRSIYEYKCDEDDMEIIKRLRSESAVGSEDFPLYLRMLQLESGLEGKRFIDFLQKLSLNPEISYQKYVQDYEDAYEGEIRRLTGTLPKRDQTLFEELRVLFPFIPFQIIETLSTFPKAHDDEIIDILKKIPKDLERESNHSFKNQIRTAIEQNLIIKIADDGNCLFESISTGLNLLTGEEDEEKLSAEKVRDQISQFEFENFNSKIFRPLIRSDANGFGVFSEWTVPELVDLKKSITAEKAGGLKIGDEILGDRHYPSTLSIGPDDAFQVQIVERERQDNSALEHVFDFKTPQEYAVIMGQDGVHGTEVELMVAACLYKVTIVVYIAKIEQFHYYFPPQEYCKNRQIIYLFKATEMGHFDVIKFPRGMFDGFDVYGLPIASYISDSCLREQGQSAVVVADFDEIQDQSARRQTQQEFAEIAPATTVTEELRQKYNMLMNGTLPIVSYTELQQMSDRVKKVNHMRDYIKLGVFLGLVNQEIEDKVYEEYLDSGDDASLIALYEYVLPALEKYRVTGQQPMLASGARAAVAAAEQIKETRVQSSEQPMLASRAPRAAGEQDPQSASEPRQRQGTMSSPANTGMMPSTRADIDASNRDLVASNDAIRVRLDESNARRDAFAANLASLSSRPAAKLAPREQLSRDQLLGASTSVVPPRQAYSINRAMSSPGSVSGALEASAEHLSRSSTALSDDEQPQSTRSNAQPDDQRQMQERLLQEHLNLLKEKELLLLQQQQQRIPQEIILGLQHQLKREKESSSPDFNKISRLEGVLRGYSNLNGGKMTTRKTRQRRGKNAKMTSRRRRN